MVGMPVNFVQPSYSEIHEATVSMCKAVADAGKTPERIVGMSRGGLIPAIVASHFFKVPLTIAQYSSKKGKGDDKNHTNTVPFIYDVEHGGPILVVDDICDSGLTMKEVVNEYEKVLGFDVTSMCLYYKKGAVFVPDMFWVELAENAPFIDFPWEIVE